ncbi:MAG TPA: hypothetical protein VH541_00985 [Gaiellaceae bacterium]|jgi:hypothetical protein
MDGLLPLACRAFPPDHRARSSAEVVDTAALVADGSRVRVAREALSLVVAGLRQRLRAESRRSLRDGATLLAGVLAIVNLAVALAGILRIVDRPHGDGASVLLWHVRYGPLSIPFIIDWWWIAFTLAAAGVLIGLACGYRRLALGAAFANLCLVAYDSIVLADSPVLHLQRLDLPNYTSDGRGHLDVFTNHLVNHYAGALAYPAGRQWLAAAIVLALATYAARQRRRPATWLPLALGVLALLVVLSRDNWGAFYFLRWALAVVVVLAAAFGAVAPRLAILAVGLTLAAAPSVVNYLTATQLHHDWVVTGVVAAALALGAVVPLVHLTHRRLT